MTLRIAEISDAASIAALSIEVWVGTYLRRGINPFFANFALHEFTAPKTEVLISDPNHFILVSENEDGIDGYIRVSENCTAPIAGCSSTEISTLYIQPRHQGKGVGKRLLLRALQRAQARGDTAVWLTTNAENAPAITFYLAQGFEHVGQTYFHIKDEKYLNNVYAYRFA